MDPEVSGALAKAVYDGDIVNFRLLFAPLSPTREDSTESFDMPKYTYLLPEPDLPDDPRFKECLAQVQRPEMAAHIERELRANRPPQLPSDLVLMLGDNAVRLGKHSSAAQAYELLRIRARMQQEFYVQADAALDAGDVPKAVRGYLIATGLGYDYAAFPEPLPVTPDFQTRALMLHAVYPQTPDDCLGLRETKAFVQTALSYLLLDPQAAARLEDRPEDLLLAVLKELVWRRDPHWDVFAKRCAEARALVRQFHERMQRQLKVGDELVQESAEEEAVDPGRIPALLLGRTIENGEWWQYLKEIAYEHPPAVLIISRQAYRDFEILIPQYRPDSLPARILELSD
jgi:hypothetical protein